jgi:hypothetical protein
LLSKDPIPTPTKGVRKKVDDKEKAEFIRLFFLFFRWKAVFLQRKKYTTPFS